MNHPTTTAIPEITAGGRHRAPVPYQRVRQVDAAHAGGDHGTHCGCTPCALPRPRGPLTSDLLAVRARLDRIADRAFLVLPAADLRAVISGGAL